MPQRASLLSNHPAPFSQSYFSNGWSSGRERASTLQSIRSSDAPSSPAQSSRDSFAEGDVKTLDYLGLVDNPQSYRIQDPSIMSGSQSPVVHPTIADLAALNAYNKNANRFRSYSVNAKEKYADDDGDELPPMDEYANLYGVNPGADSAAAQALAIQEAVRQHNLDVQAFANLASANRPRARTAGVLDSPSTRLLRNYLPTPSRLDSSITAADLETNGVIDYDGLTDAVQQMHLEHKHPLDAVDPGLLESPTRALWLGNIPPSTTVSSLNVIFANFGPIESTRVLTHKSCGFVNFENIESAMQAKVQLNDKEIFPGAGPIRIGYAKVPSNAATPGATGSFQSPSPDPFAKDHPAGLIDTGLRPDNINAATAAAALATPNMRDMRGEIYAIVKELGANQEEEVRITAAVEQAISYDLYHSEIPPIPEPSHSRIHDAPRLRDVRKRIDNQSVTQPEIENIAMEMLPEVAELSSDYLGNTVVQKLFENCSEPVKEAMLAEISPHLAEIGVHKNGTWAAQKIIDVARTPAQMQMIVDALRPYAPALFLDQYGNYVMQCCLRFQSPANDFIFDAMLQRLWEVAQGRFGARAMRACLESHYATRDQQRMMAAAIALHSVQLATNANGALLLTWFLDTCTFPRRRSVLAPRLIPHLVHLCTHKVAYLTVLKIINQRTETDAREAILDALFFSPNDATLQDILSDQACGATFIFKALTTPFLEEKNRQSVAENVRNVLLRLKAQPQQGYKRLMDEVGLATRHGGTPASREASQTRSSSRGPAAHNHLPHLDTQPPFPRQQYQMPGQSAMDPQQYMGPGLQRSTSIDSNGFDPYSTNGLVTPAYTHSPALSTNSPVSLPQHMQYQQAMLQQQQASQRMNGFYPPGAVPMNGFASPAPQMVDPYGRPSMGGSPISAPGMGVPNGFPPGGYSPNMAMNGFQYPMGYYPPQQQGHVGGQRRGRVSLPTSHVQ